MRKIEKILGRGGIGVLPTDTIYGLVGSALNRRTVERIYKVRGRNPKKPFIILIGSISDLRRFGIRLAGDYRKLVKRFWPGPVSIIFPCASRKFQYLHRGVKSLAFRLPRDRKFRALLNMTGPLVAPSANPEGKPYSKTIREAQRYFRDRADFYVDGGAKKKSPSEVVRIGKDGRVVVVRGG